MSHASETAGKGEVPPSARARIAGLVAAALELPTERRRDFLRAEAGGDRMVAEEAISLVAAIEHAGGFMERPTGSGGGESVQNAGKVRGEGPGSVVGPYTLLEQIGEGGFGVVFMAEQHQPVKRRVAVKIIKLGMDTRAVVSRFEAERQALAMMEHSSIARVLDAGATASGRPYFAMELVKGLPITLYCGRERLGTRERLGLFEQVCSAVQHAHSKGVIHRDLKPGNVLVTVMDGRALVKVIDFGIAKATAEPLTDGAAVTGFRQMLGTPAYMSPEQAADSGTDIDTRADVYSLGVLLYELLTGTTPVQSERLRGVEWAQVQRMIREEDPPTPSRRLSSMDVGPVAAERGMEPARLMQALRGDLDWIVMKCLEKDRARRYVTADALAQDVRNTLEGRAVAAAPPSRRYRARKFVRRNRGAVLGAAAVGLALVFGVVGMSVGLVRARAQRARAESEKTGAEGLAEFMRSAFASVGPSVAVGRDTTIVREVLDRAAERIRAGELAASPEGEVRLMRTIGATYASIARFDEAEAMLTRALELSRARNGNLHAETAACLNELGALRSAHERKFAEAEPLYKEARSILERVAPGDGEETAMSISGLAGVAQELGRLDEALALHGEALEMQRRLARGADGREHDSDGVASAMNEMAGGLMAVSRPKEAETLYRTALEIRRRLHTGDHPDVALAVNNLADVVEQLGKAEEVVPLYRETLDMRKRLYIGDHPDVFVSINNLAFALQGVNKGEQAEPLFRDALAMSRRLYSGDHPFISSSLNNLAGLLMTVGRPAEAEPLFKEALEMRRRMFPNGHSSVANSLNCYAAVLAAMGKREEALPYYRESAELNGKTLGAEHHQTASAESGLAVNLVKLGRPAEAEEHYLAALHGFEATYKGDHPRTQNVLGLLAQCLQKEGKHEDAVRRAEQSAAMAARLYPEGHAARVTAEKVRTEIKGPD